MKIDDLFSRFNVVRAFRQYLLISLCGILAFGSNLAEAQATSSRLSIEAVVDQVVRQNKRVEAAKLMAESARREVGPAGAWSDPMLMVGAQNVPTDFDFNKDDMTMKMIGLSQEIPYSGYKAAAADAARADVKTAETDIASTVVDLVVAAKTAYIDLYFQQLNLEELKRQRELLQQVVDATLSRLRANRSGQEEALAAQADLWRLESAILSTEQQLTDARATLNSLRGADQSDTLFVMNAPSIPDIPISSVSWLSAAENNYPALNRLRSQSESYAESAKSMRRMRWPMLELNASYGIRTGYSMGEHGAEEKRGDMLNFGATISLPIFAGRQQGSAARSMDAMRLSTDAEAEQLRRDIQAQLTQIRDRADRLSQSLSLYRDRIVPTSEDAYRSALSGFTADRVPLTSLLGLATSVYRDRVTANEIEADLLRTLIEVDRYTLNARSLYSQNDSNR